MELNEGHAGTGWDRLPEAIPSVVTLASSTGARPRIEGPPWRIHLRALEDALAQRDLNTAERAWHAAHVAAFASRRWDGLLDVGQASLRLGEVSGTRLRAHVKARELFLGALLLAREQGDADGVLRAAEAFAALGDHGVVERCLGVARDLATRAGDPGAEARVRAVGQLLVAR